MFDYYKALSELIKCNTPKKTIIHIKQILEDHCINVTIYKKNKELPNLFAVIEGEKTLAHCYSIHMRIQFLQNIWLKLLLRTADFYYIKMLTALIKEHDPDAIPIPLVLTGTTDARFFKKLNIQTYGFTPMNLPENINFSGLIHSANERIPINSLNFGVKILRDLVLKYE